MPDYELTNEEAFERWAVNNDLRTDNDPITEQWSAFAWAAGFAYALSTQNAAKEEVSDETFRGFKDRLQDRIDSLELAQERRVNEIRQLKVVIRKLIDLAGEE